MKSKIFSTAWSLFKSGLFSTFAAALSAAWKKNKMMAKLAAGIVKFQYIKSDGSIRTATGTTNWNLFNYEAKGSEVKQNPAVVRYFDMDANGFRSFYIDRLI